MEPSGTGVFTGCAPQMPLGQRRKPPRDAESGRVCWQDSSECNASIFFVVEMEATELRKKPCVFHQSRNFRTPGVPPERLVAAVRLQIGIAARRDGIRTGQGIAPAARPASYQSAPEREAVLRRWLPGKPGVPPDAAGSTPFCGIKAPPAAHVTAQAAPLEQKKARPQAGTKLLFQLTR